MEKHNSEEGITKCLWLPIHRPSLMLLIAHLLIHRWFSHSSAAFWALIRDGCRKFNNGYSCGKTHCILQTNYGPAMFQRNQYTASLHAAVKASISVSWVEHGWSIFLHCTVFKVVPLSSNCTMLYPVWLLVVSQKPQPSKEWGQSVTKRRSINKVISSD